MYRVCTHIRPQGLARAAEVKRRWRGLSRVSVPLGSSGSFGAFTSSLPLQLGSFCACIFTDAFPGLNFLTLVEPRLSKDRALRIASVGPRATEAGVREHVIVAREPESGVRAERLTTSPPTPHHHRAATTTVETLLSAHKAPDMESGIDASPAQMPAASSRTDLYSRMGEPADIKFEDSRTNTRMTLPIRREGHPPSPTSVTR